MVLVLFAYPAWLAMMAVHETGHALRAVMSGGAVERIELPLLGFSRTDVSPNPRPHFVAWGGPIWGAAAPFLLALALSQVARRVTLRTGFVTRQGVWRLLDSSAWMFCGFCSVANGAYLAAGAFGEVGDAGDLLRHGTPFPVLLVVGTAMIAAGLTVWHCLGRSGRGPAAGLMP